MSGEDRLINWIIFGGQMPPIVWAIDEPQL